MRTAISSFIRRFHARKSFRNTAPLRIRVSCVFISLLPRVITVFLISSCILPLLSAETPSRLKNAGVSGARPGVELKKTTDTIEVLVGGQPFTSYYFRGFNKPVYFPLRTASGIVVTRSWPMTPDVPGEAHDHPHQKGLWLTHGSVNGVDFWSEDRNSGKILHREFLEIKEGDSIGLLKSINDWVMPDGKKIVEELREVRIYSKTEPRILDFDFRLTAVNGPVVFGDTKEGSFGMRLAQAFVEGTGGRIENSSGSVGEANCWGKRAEWTDFTAQINGQTVGVAVFNHPASFRYPTYWHVRGYTLFAANPFGWHDFLKDPAKDGSYHLEAGQSITLRYRVYIHAGSTEDARIAGQYQAYVQEVK